MKKIILTTALIVLFTNVLNAQERRLTADFTKIIVEDDFRVTLVPSDRNEVIIPRGLVFGEGESRAVDTITGTYRLRYTNPGSKGAFSRLGKDETVIIHFKSLEELTLSGTATARSETPIIGEQLKLVLSGASSATLDVKVDKLISNLSGASNLTLSGMAEVHSIETFGASRVSAQNLNVELTDVTLFGASSTRITTSQATGTVSGASRLTLNEDAEDNVSRSGMASTRRQTASREFTEEMRDIEEEMRELEEEMKELEKEMRNLENERGIPAGAFFGVGPDGFFIQTPQIKTKKKFTPSYGYVDFGFSGYGQDFFQHTLPEDYETMQLKQNVSFVFNINFIQYGIRLGQSNFGMASGFGIGWNSYRFLEENVIPMRDRETRMFVAEPYDGPENRKYSRSTLRTSWLKVPLYLNYKKSDFSVAAGVVGNVRMGAMSRQIYRVPGNSKQRVKTNDNFYLNAFRMDTELRFGYKDIGFFATYSLTEMFLRNRGPELYPFSFGITLGM
jgi:hypothetical protein